MVEIVAGRRMSRKYEYSEEGGGIEADHGIIGYNQLRFEFPGNTLSQECVQEIIGQVVPLSIGSNAVI